MLIRTALPSDHANIEALLPRAYGPVLAQLSPEDGAAFGEAIVAGVRRYSQRGTWLVAEQDGQVAGCVAWFAPHSTSHPLFLGNCAHVQLLGVDPAHAGRGIGKALMQHCLAAAEATGAGMLALQTSELMVAARSLYESLGLRVSRTLAPVFGRPTYLYTKELGALATGEAWPRSQ